MAKMLFQRLEQIFAEHFLIFLNNRRVHDLEYPLFEFHIIMTFLEKHGYEVAIGDQSIL